MRKTQTFLTAKSRFFPGCVIAALGLAVLSATLPADARRAYSSYGDIDEKTLENILNGKSPAKRAARPKPKRRKPALSTGPNSPSVNKAAKDSAAKENAVNSSGSIATSAVASSSSRKSGSQSSGQSDSLSGSQSTNQSANPNAASFAALAPVPTLQKGSLKGMSKKLSALIEMSPPTSLDMDKEQALDVGSK